MAAANADARVRVYVGGLPADTSAAELQERFSRFVANGNCRLQSVELLPPKGLFALSADATHRGFAYLTLQGEAAVEITEKLVKTYHKTKWRGSVLHVEPAKPDYMERLQQEWQEQREREQAQSAAMAEARGLVAAAQREMGELETINVGGVEFRGKKRTTFDYEDIDFETAFAPKPKAAVAVVEQTNGYRSANDDEEMPHTEMGSSGEGQQEDEEDDADDADYWATSGDESEKAGDVGEEGQAEPSAASEDDENNVESEDSESEDDEIPAEDAVAVDDVEAFVQQMLEQEEETQPSASAVTPEKKEESPTKATRDQAQVDEEDVDAYAQQVEREEANARRIAALEAKMKQKQERQQAAVVKIDLSMKSNKKITFDDSGNEQEENEADGAQDNDADGNGSGAITNWLDSSDDEGDEKNGDYGELRDGSDDEDDDAKKRKKRNAFEFLGGDDDNEDAKAFAVRPEFLGERGKKLFELQKRFGGDQRFRMDARFIEDEENEYGGTDGLLPEDDDDDQVIAAIADGPVGELQEFQDEDGEDQAAANEREWLQEQDLALSVIAEIFPDMDVENIKYKMRVKIKKDPIKEASWMGQMMRYDPRDIHARHAYEIPLEDMKSKQQNSGTKEDGESDDEDATQTNDADKKRKARDEKEVLIGGDRFFSTSSALGSLFTRVRKNSEDGIAGEAALDGVFGFSRGVDDVDTAAAGGDAANKSEDVQGAGGATFKLSSLFDFPVEEEKEKNSRLTAMGEKLFEEDNDDDEEKPWHFTQSFFSDEREDVRMDTDNEDEDEDDDGDEAEAKDEEEDGKKKPKKKALKKSLAEFLEFGKSFVCPQDGSTNQKSKEWTEKRKKLTLDFKRKRKDALRNKKKIQQRLAKQHQSKKQKTSR